MSTRSPHDQILRDQVSSAFADGSLDDAVSAGAQMQGWRERNSRLNRVALSHVSARQVPEASTTAQLIGNPGECAVVLEKVVQAQEKGGLVGGARATADRIKGKLWKAWSRAHVARAEAAADLFDEAKAVELPMDRQGTASVRIVSAELESGLIADAKATAGRSADLQDLTSAICKAQIEAGRFRSAMMTAYCLDHAPSRDDALAAIVQAQETAGLLSDAKLAVAAMAIGSGQRG